MLISGIAQRADARVNLSAVQSVDAGTQQWSDEG
jgi:hypothetical protein